ncbi:hypothetical protein GWK08_18150 [Leptobacterium flavescens]|uniref:Redoxin domain-containing protein n=1 Tax=Leptobacterium flavescens TaxID=472055 RepID=A0A6P0UXH6_9FLAO|nr:hypothetical protein [Leptobacterium flavescens]NER15383.1 hypothetical protein [Leptobacterium flavescens]
MKKLELYFDEELQGKFELKKLNLLLVFQVNCPGCFSYALPVFNRLYEQWNNGDISFLALSTAFEDFDRNTEENTQRLVKEGFLVGETKRFMAQQGFEELPYSLDFPVAMDKIEKELPDLDRILDNICSSTPGFDTLPEFEKVSYRNRVAAYLNSLEKTALTFTLNGLRGTPSFVLFNSDYDILSHWFGHVHYENIENAINKFSE